MTPRRFIIGITGASATIYGVRLLEVLRECGEVETHLVISRAAGVTLRLECPQWTLDRVKGLADVIYKESDIAASIASGSYPVEAMVVIPASMKTVAQIAHGTGETLLHRACDVTLKEQRRLIVVPRETPMHLGHLRNLTTLAELGAVVVPPLVAFTINLKRYRRLWITPWEKCWIFCTSTTGSTSGGKDPLAWTEGDFGGGKHFWQTARAGTILDTVLGLSHDVLEELSLLVQLRLGGGAQYNDSTPVRA